MSTAAPALDLATVRGRRSWLDFLRTELAPTPGRLNATLRIVVATTIVLVTSMTLEVPSIGLSLFMVVYVTKLTSTVPAQTSIATLLGSTVGLIVVTVACAFALLIFRLTIDHPALRLGAMALGFFIGMYGTRVLALGPIGFVIGLVVLVSQAYVDIFPGPEPLVRALLWIWVVVAYPVAVTVAVNLLLLPADPEPVLRREAAARLRTVARAIAAPPGSDGARRAAADLDGYATTGSGALLKLVRLAELRDALVEPLRAERVGKIQLLERLVRSAAFAVDLRIRPSPGQRARLERIAVECDRLAAAAVRGTRPEPVSWALVTPEDAAPAELAPVLAEMEQVLHELPLVERPASGQVAADTADRHLLVPDAFTNPRYAQFALKVTLAAMFCYVVYTAVDWAGIHTCMITCAIVALATTGATIHKATLRLVGCAIGGALALASIVFLIPRMTDITALALLVAAVTAFAGWLAMGSPRTAYAGVQVAFAFYLAVLPGLAPTEDVTVFRDRFVGIVFGIAVMAVVFTYIWPERAGSSMVESLVAALRRTARLAAGQIGATKDTAADLRAHSAAAWQALDRAGELRELNLFEAEALGPSGAATGERLGRLIDATRRVMLAQTALGQYRAAAAVTTPASNEARIALGYAVASTLESVAGQIETGKPGGRVDLRTPLAVLAAGGADAGAADPIASEIALSEAVVSRVEALEGAAGMK